MVPSNRLHFPNLRILNIGDELDERRLLIALSGGVQQSSLDCLDDEAFVRSYQPKLSLPTYLLINLLAAPIGSLHVRTAVIESGYVDRDSNVAYTQLYARAFRDYPRRTVRLHFFDDEVTYDTLKDEKKLESQYLGFTVASPTRPGHIGRTFIAPPRSESPLVYVPCQVELPINLAGARIRPAGTAYTQQDQRAAACASAAAWMSTAMAARRFGFDMPVRSMAEITQLATRHSLPGDGRGVSPGLSVDQIIWALNEMNYEPLVHVLKDSHEAKELIYRYVESGVPPILGVFLPSHQARHAITIVGHTYTPTLRPSLQGERTYISASDWCPHFLAHDDGVGPYVRLSVGELTAHPQSPGSKFPGLVLDETNPLLGRYATKVADWYRGAVIEVVIAPLPPRHPLRPEQAAEKGIEIIRQAYVLHKDRLGLTMPDPPVYRTYLISSNDFKRQFTSADGEASGTLRRTGATHELADWYRGSLYPRYVWVTELCSLDDRAGKAPAELRVVADVTIDPTSSPLCFDFITLHLPHVFVRMAPTDNDYAAVLASIEAKIAEMRVEEDQPYSPMLREASVPIGNGPSVS